jgi:signal peptidase I
MKNTIREILVTVIVSLLVFLSLQVTIKSSVVFGSSMEPNFETGQRLIANKITYKIDEIKRGDVVILRPPTDNHIEYIKRIVGLPGETVEVRNGLVYIDGSPLSEPYVLENPSYNMKRLTIPTDYYFVLGDNRNHSDDSHIWGPLPRENIIGKVWLSFWPPSEWEINP